MVVIDSKSEFLTGFLIHFQNWFSFRLFEQLFSPPPMPTHTILSLRIQHSAYAFEMCTSLSQKDKQLPNKSRINSAISI